MAPVEGAVHSDVPVLLISGEHDPVTPPRWADQARLHLSNATHVVVRGGSHSFAGMAGCVDVLIARFLERGRASGLDTSCAERSVRPPFLLP